jgi:hypothetical protein
VVRKWEEEVKKRISRSWEEGEHIDTPFRSVCKFIFQRGNMLTFLSNPIENDQTVTAKMYFQNESTPRSIRTTGTNFVEIDPVTHGFKTRFPGLTEEPIEVVVRDGRKLEIPMTLDNNGFQLSPCHFDDIDFSQDMEILTKYYPQVADYLKETLGASKVYCFAHMVR